MTMMLQKNSEAETRRLMRTQPDQVLFPVRRMSIEFGFPPEALRQELESGRLVAVQAGLQGEPCVSGKAFLDWTKNGNSPGVLVTHVLAYLAARKAEAN